VDISSSRASEANGYRNQNHDFDDSSVENEAYQLAPMEVESSLPPPSQLNQHSPLLPCGPNRKHYLKKPSISAKQTSWLLYISGMIGMSFLNPLCCVLAMKYANPSILAPFSGLTLVWIVLFSGMSVGEHPGRSQKVACALIVLGEVLVALFGDHTNEEGMDVEDVVSK
jgi:drug/metabolite transporter (DMT)-like permease